MLNSPTRQVPYQRTFVCGGMPPSGAITYATADAYLRHGLATLVEGTKQRGVLRLLPRGEQAYRAARAAEAAAPQTESW